MQRCTSPGERGRGLPFNILVRIDPHAAISSSGHAPMESSSFSILVRIDPHAADSGRARASGIRAFQYPRADRPSCSGWTIRDSVVHITFQYPRADRPSCSNVVFRPYPGFPYAFQYPRADRPSCSYRAQRCGQRAHASFSILVRIDPHAVKVERMFRTRVRVFQYPRADRPSCSRLAFSTARLNHPFQYPRADRPSCSAHC